MLTFDTSKLSRLDSYIRSAGQVSIVVHTHPDGDAIGSAVALRSYLMHRTGAQVMIVVPDRCPQNLSFLFDEKALIVASDRPEDSSRWISGSDLIFCLDINAFDRTGIVEQSLRASVCAKVLVDHHLHPAAADFDVVFSTTEVSSTCELLFWVLLSVSGGCAADLPSECAYALMTGMTTDTNNFANSVFPRNSSMRVLTGTIY